MVNKKTLGLIDSQDAIIGNPLYDVVSLIDDVRIKLTNNLQNQLLKYYYSKSKFKKEKFENLKNDYDILSVQRNLKILGIFVRLLKRDNKTKYIKYLPYTWKLIEKRLKNPIFKDLNYLLKKYFKLNKIKEFKKYMKIKHGMILAAGLGKRMQPLTLEIPKPLLKIGKESLLERALDLLIKNDVKNVTINIHHLSNKIEKFLKEKILKSIYQFPMKKMSF